MHRGTDSGALETNEQDQFFSFTSLSLHYLWGFTKEDTGGAEAGAS